MAPNLTVTVSPKLPLTRPEIICAHNLFGGIKNIVTHSVLTLTTGAPVSTVKFTLLLVVFPARSLTLAFIA